MEGNLTLTKIADKSVKPELLFKILLVGDSNVGKTSTILRFVEDIWLGNPYYNPCSAMDFRLQTVEMDGTYIRLMIMDTYGERFITFTSIELRKTHGAFLMFDLTCMQSFKNLKIWYDKLGNDVVKVLLGNKCDLKNERVVSYEDAQEYADELGVPYLETSAKAPTNVDQAFMTLTSSIKKIVDDGTLNIDIHKRTVSLKAHEPSRCTCDI